MCMCGKPTVNGEPGYSWNGEVSHTYPVNPPALKEGDELLYDEPGRRSGIDSHSYHLRIVKAKIGGYLLRVRHGGGDEAISLGYHRRQAIDVMQTRKRKSWRCGFSMQVSKWTNNERTDFCRADEPLCKAIQKASSRELRSALPSWRNAMRHAPEAKAADAKRIYDLLISELSRRAD